MRNQEKKLSQVSKLLKLFSSLLKCAICAVGCRFTMRHNGLQLQEVGDFEALNCLQPQNLIRSTKLHLTTEPPIYCRCCYAFGFLLCCPFFVITNSLKSRLRIKFQVSNLSQLVLLLSPVYYSFRHLLQLGNLVVQLLKSRCPLLHRCQ